jgi:hypothetical protein
VALVGLGKMEFWEILKFDRFGMTPEHSGVNFEL